MYVKRREDDEDELKVIDVVECRVCFKSGKSVMIECDDCLNGFHLKCSKPPLKAVPEEDWICQFCTEAKRTGKKVEFPELPNGKRLVRTLRDKLLTSDLWAMRIESLWKDVDGTFRFQGRWYVIPEETAVTAAGRQPHSLRRELYLRKDYADIEVFE